MKDNNETEAADLFNDHGELNDSAAGRARIVKQNRKKSESSKSNMLLAESKKETKAQKNIKELKRSRDAAKNPLRAIGSAFGIGG